MIYARNSIIPITFGSGPRSAPLKSDRTRKEKVKKFDLIEDVKENGETQKNELRHEHLDALECAFKPFRGEQSIHYMAFSKMKTGAQPFINGAISTTVYLLKEFKRPKISQTPIHRREHWGLNMLRFIVTDSAPSAQHPKTVENPTEANERV